MGLVMSIRCLNVHRSVSIITEHAISHDTQLQYHACSTNKQHGWRHSNIKHLLLYCMGQLMLGATWIFKKYRNQFKILGTKRVTWIKLHNVDPRLHNEELNDLYSSPNIVRVIKSRRMRWAGHVARMGEERGVYRVLVGKQEGKRPLGRPRRRWVDNIRTDLQEVGCVYMDWMGWPRIETGGRRLCVR